MGDGFYYHILCHCLEFKYIRFGTHFMREYITTVCFLSSNLKETPSGCQQKTTSAVSMIKSSKPS